MRSLRTVRDNTFIPASCAIASATCTMPSEVQAYGAVDGTCPRCSTECNHDAEWNALSDNSPSNDGSAQAYLYVRPVEGILASYQGEVDKTRATVSAGKAKGDA